MNVEEEFEDVLQNIEFAVVSTFREHPQLLDFDVERVYETLIKEYSRPAGATSPTFPTEMRAALYARVKHVCDWRLGRGEIGDTKTRMPAPEPITPEEMVACLKRLRRSVNMWTKRGGRQGYLEFVGDFIP